VIAPLTKFISGSEEGAANAAGLHESLTSIESPKLNEVKASANELAGLYARSAAPSEINAALSKLAQQAEAL